MKAIPTVVMLIMKLSDDYYFHMNQSNFDTDLSP